MFNRLVPGRYSFFCSRFVALVSVLRLAEGLPVLPSLRSFMRSTTSSIAALVGVAFWQAESLLKARGVIAEEIRKAQGLPKPEPTGMEAVKATLGEWRTWFSTTFGGGTP